MLTEIGDLGFNDIARLERKEDLAAMPGRSDSRAFVHVGTDISLVGDMRCAGMDANTDVYRSRRQRLASLERGINCALRTRKRIKECVALRVYLDTAVTAESRAKDPAVLRQRLGISFLTEIMEEPS
jgi:hypothetical protein